MTSLPRIVARLNKVGLNRVIGPLAPRIAGFGVIVHRGRRSGRTYRTPVNVFRTGVGYVVALTYGPGADWVRNVLAAGGCTLETQGHPVQLTAPRLFRDETGRHLPLVPRRILRLAGIADFLELVPEVVGTDADR